MLVSRAPVLHIRCEIVEDVNLVPCFLVPTTMNALEAPNPEVGDFALIMDNNLPNNNQFCRRVIKVIPGKVKQLLVVQ